MRSSRGVASRSSRSGLYIDPFIFSHWIVVRVYEKKNRRGFIDSQCKGTGIGKCFCCCFVPLRFLGLVAACYASLIFNMLLLTAHPDLHKQFLNSTPVLFKVIQFHNHRHLAHSVGLRSSSAGTI